MKSYSKLLKETSKELKITIEEAQDVLYLRERSRWSIELEQKLIEYYKNNIPVNIMEFDEDYEHSK